MQRSIFSTFICSITVLLLIVSLLGHPLEANAVVGERIDGSSFNKQEVEEFIDNFMDENMQKYNVPGVTISVVKGDEVLLKKGYGYADIENKTPVNPDETIFRIASITKLFTSTAVMQLYEKGLLDLHKDINEYLESFSIKDTYSKPITMFHLLTHTNGFDETSIGMESLGYEEAVTLEEYLIQYMPDRIRKPGIVTQYSNYGMALAGYTVEEISGLSYKKYIDENIFKYLEMDHSYININKNLEAKIAREYSLKNGQYKRVSEYSLDALPVGAIYSTANDMSHFMIAMFNKGKFNNKEILGEAIIQEMQTQQFSNDINVPGVCYGFMENIKNNHRFIGHGGSLNGVRSEILLDTENKIGLFIAANSSSGDAVTIMLVEEFIDKFYPLDKEIESVYKSNNINDKNYLQKFEGYYRSNRYSRGRIDKIQLLLYPNIRVESNSNRRLVVTGIGPTEEYIHTADLVFTNPNNGRKIAFEEDHKGNIVRMYPFLGEWTCEKVKWYESSNLHLIVLLICMLIFLFALIVMGVMPLIRLIRNKRKQQTALVKYFRVLAGVISLFNIAFIMGLVLSLSSLATISDISWGLSIEIKMLLLIPIITSILTLILVIINATLLKKKSLTKIDAIFYTVVSVTSVVYVIFMNYYNLIGYQY